MKMNLRWGGGGDGDVQLVVESSQVPDKLRGISWVSVMEMILSRR